MSGTGGQERRRLPLAPLLRAAGNPSIKTLAIMTGFGYRQMYRWINDGGLTINHADRAACAIGLHPANIWPEFLEAS